MRVMACSDSKDWRVMNWEHQSTPLWLVQAPAPSYLSDMKETLRKSIDIAQVGKRIKVGPQCKADHHEVTGNKVRGQLCDLPLAPDLLAVRHERRIVQTLP